MAYDSRYRDAFLIGAIFAMVANIFSTTINTLLYRAYQVEPIRMLVDAFSTAWRVVAAPFAIPARYLIDTGRMCFAQTRAFVERAMTHPSYTAGHFDPGRQPA